MIKFTENAANQIKKLQEATDAEGKYLRILIECGGCSGNQYRLGFDVETEGDTRFDYDKRKPKPAESIHFLTGQ